MTFYEKYKQLQNKAFLTKLLTDTVYSTMCIENQEVSKPKVTEIVLNALKEQQLKGIQLVLSFIVQKISQISYSQHFFSITPSALWYHYVCCLTQNNRFPIALRNCL